MKRPIESDYTSYVAYTRALEEYCDALAQPEQEPVAWMNPSWIEPDTRGWQSDSFESIPIEGWLPIYTTPPQRPWVGLTDEDIFCVLNELQAIYNGPPTTDTRVIFARAIEAKLRRKNT